MKRELLFLSSLCLLLAGCVSSSGPMPFGKDSYMITTSAGGSFNNPGAAFQGAVKEANEHCASFSEIMIPRNTETTGHPGLPGGAKFIYSCVDNNVPENQRPNMRKEPDVTIESRTE